MGDFGTIWWLQNKINKYAFAFGQIEGIIEYAKGGYSDTEALVRHIQGVLEELRKEQKRLDDEQKLA